MIIRIINALILVLLEPDLIHCQVDHFHYVVTLKWEGRIVSDGFVVVEFYEEFIVFVAFHYFFDHGEVVGTRDVIFISVIHHILDKVELNHSILKG